MNNTFFTLLTTFSFALLFISSLWQNLNFFIIFSFIRWLRWQRWLLRILTSRLIFQLYLLIFGIWLLFGSTWLVFRNGWTLLFLRVRFFFRLILASRWLAGLSLQLGLFVDFRFKITRSLALCLLFRILFFYILRFYRFLRLLFNIILKLRPVLFFTLCRLLQSFLIIFTSELILRRLLGTTTFLLLSLNLRFWLLFVEFIILLLSLAVFLFIWFLYF